MIGQIEKIQTILNADDCYFPKIERMQNSIIKNATIDMICNIRHEADKVVILSWYSKEKNNAKFEKLLQLLILKTDIKTITKDSLCGYIAEAKKKYLNEKPNANQG